MDRSVDHGVLLTGMMTDFPPGSRIALQSAAALTIVLAAALLLFTFVFDGQITGFFRIGDVLPLSPRVDASSVRQVEGEVGYDGQLFLTIALDPFLEEEGSIAALDNPRYRYRRILYPALGFLAGFGNPALIPYAMVAINVLSAAVLVLLAGLFFPSSSDRSGARPFLPLLALAVPGLWISLCLSTADLFASTLLVAALVSGRGKRGGLSASFLGFACLAREVCLATAAVLALLRFVEGRRKEALLYGLSAVPSLLWISMVYRRLPGGTSGAGENFGLPFRGIAEKMHLLFTAEATRANLLEVFSFTILLAAALLLFISSSRDGRLAPAVYAAALPPLALLALSRLQILGFYVDYLRVFGDLFFLNLLTAGEGRFVLPKRVLLSLGGAGTAAYAFYVLRT